MEPQDITDKMLSYYCEKCKKVYPIVGAFSDINSGRAQFLKCSCGLGILSKNEDKPNMYTLKPITLDAMTKIVMKEVGGMFKS